MRAWLIDGMNGVGGLRLAEVADPQPGPGEVVLDILYAGLNPADRYLAEGQYPARPPMPHILGRDGMGIVSAVGPGEGSGFRVQGSGIAVGDRRVILRSEIGVTRAGTFADRVAVPVESLVAAPAGWTEEQMGGAPLVYLTAYQALTQWTGSAAGLGEAGMPGTPTPATGEVVLITGASGGVGVASVQLARAMGHTVVALSRDEGKRGRLLELGAQHVLDPADPTWRKRLKDQLGGRRVDLAIDNIGGSLLPEVIDTLGEWGKVSIVGRLAGPVPQFNTAALFFRRLRLGGVAVGTYTAAESRAVWINVLGLLSRTKATPLVDRVFPFEQLPAAFDRLQQGPMGKVVLAVGR